MLYSWVTFSKCWEPFLRNCLIWNSESCKHLWTSRLHSAHSSLYLSSSWVQVYGRGAVVKGVEHIFTNLLVNIRVARVRCRSELIDYAWIVIVPGQKCIKKGVWRTHVSSSIYLGVDCADFLKLIFHDKHTYLPLYFTRATIPQGSITIFVYIPGTFWTIRITNHEGEYLEQGENWDTAVRFQKSIRTQENYFWKPLWRKRKCSHLTNLYRKLCITTVNRQPSLDVAEKPC